MTRQELAEKLDALWEGLEILTDTAEDMETEEATVMDLSNALALIGAAVVKLRGRA
jgi:hypothetical protein